MKDNKLLAKVLTEANPALLSSGILIIRLTIGILLFTAGSGKVFGWFGGYGVEKTLQGFSQMGFSAFLTYLSMFTEFFGSILLILGLFTRIAAFAVTINMIVATIVSLPRGFLGPTGAQTAFIFLMMSLVILLSGPLSYSIDHFIFSKDHNRK
jgi:putative oxidoreductase